MAFTEAAIVSGDAVNDFMEVAELYDLAKAGGDDALFMKYADDLADRIEWQLARFDADVRPCFVDWHSKQRTVWLMMIEQIKADVKVRRIEDAAFKEGVVATPEATETPAADALIEAQTIQAHIVAAKGFFNASAFNAMFTVTCEGDKEAASARADEWQESQEPTPEPAPAPEKVVDNPGPDEVE